MRDPMNHDPDAHLTIGRMRLALPPGYAGRADAIARQVSAHLARLPLDRSGQIARLTVPTIDVRPGETDAALALRIAHAVHGQIGRALGPTPIQTPGGRSGDRPERPQPSPPAAGRGAKE